MIVNGNFNALEILKIAISMEEEGMQFYANGAKYTDGKLKDFLLHAAVQERQHKERFQKLYNDFLEKKDRFNDDYLFDPDVSAYLKSLAENEVFQKKPQKEDAFTDVRSAAQQAVEAEETTVALYTRMYEGAQYEEMKEMLAALIEEEKAHVEYFKGLLEKAE